MPVRTVRRRRVVRPLADGDSPRRTRVKARKDEVGPVSSPLRVQNSAAIGLIDRRNIEARANLTDPARAPGANVELLHLSAIVAEHGVDDRFAVRGPRGGERSLASRYRARLLAIAIDDLQHAVVHVRDARLGDPALSEHPLLDLVGDSVQNETPITIAPVEEKMLRLQ